MTPLVKLIPKEKVVEFMTVGVSGASALSFIIQVEKDAVSGEEVLIPQILTGSVLSHVAIALRHNGALMWFESAEHGCQFVPLEKYLSVTKGGLCLLAPMVKFHLERRALMKAKALEIEGLPYDALGLIGKLWHLICKRKKWKENPLSNSGYFCSAAVELIYRAGGFKVTEYESVRLNEPKDFMISKLMRRVV